MGLQWMSVFIIVFGISYTTFIAMVSNDDERRTEHELHGAS